MRALTQELQLDRVDHDELLELLGRRYGSCWRVAPRAITFPAKDCFSVRVRLCRDGIDGVTGGPALTSNELKGLRAQVEDELIAPGTKRWWRAIYFSHLPVKGGHRLAPIEAQFLPPPRRAPKPGQLLARHPFVFEFPFQSTGIWSLDALRIERLEVAWARLLTALLEGCISYEPRRLKQLWTTQHRSLRAKSTWTQARYFIPEHTYLQGHRSKHPRRRILVVDSASYRGNWAHRKKLLLSDARLLEEFHVPDDLDRLVAIYLSLDRKRRDHFNRTAAFIHQAFELEYASASAAFLSCTQAIESLMARPPRSPCPSCGLDTSPGAAKRFRSFIKGLQPNSDRGDVAVADLYSIRSAISHGASLFDRDLAPWRSGHTLGLTDLSDQEKIDAAMRLAKNGLRQWLSDQSSSPGPSPPRVPKER